MSQADFPARAWPDMCAVYRDERLAGVCLALQDRHGVDVPLLMMLTLADRAGYGIGAAALPALEAEATAWRETVIVPLRRVRQEMKGRFGAVGETALRDAVKRLELEAEHQHVLRLAKSLPPPTGETGAARQYLLARGVTESVSDDFIETFAVACATQLASADHE